MIIPIRDRTLLKAILLGSICLIAAGCQLIDFRGGSDDLTFVNRADRPFAPIILDAKELPLVDPRPWLTAEEFEERKIEAGSSAEWTRPAATRRASWYSTTTGSE